jgi:hypothetical protein
MVEHCDKDCKELKDIETRMDKAEIDIVDIRICSGKKVTWGKLGTIIVIIITVFGAGALITWANARDVPKVKEDVEVLQNESTALKIRQETILDNTKESKNDIKEVRNDVEEIKQLLAELKASLKK